MKGRKRSELKRVAESTHLQVPMMPRLPMVRSDIYESHYYKSSFWSWVSRRRHGIDEDGRDLIHDER